MKSKSDKVVLASTSNPIEKSLVENNKKIFDYFDTRIQELKETLGYKEKLKEWNSDLFKFSMDHRV